jgi:hypothetical protein
MSPVLQTLLVTGVLVALVLSILAVLGSLFQTRRLDALELGAERGRVTRKALKGLTDEAIEAGSYGEPAPATVPEWEKAWAAGQPPKDPERLAPVPYNEENPPKIISFTGAPEKYRCKCHNRFLVPGEQIIWWPRPDLAEGAVEIYHPDAAKGRP